MATPVPDIEAEAPAFHEAKEVKKPGFCGGICNRCKMIVVGLLVITGVTVGLSLAFTGDPNPINYFVPVDPPGASEAERWDATAGLRLNILNACEDRWEPYFENSVLEWNESEAAILTTRRSFYDYDCDPVTGMLKVCNGDYGDTNWRGINLAFVSKSTDRIVHSVAKLNDFHLSSDTDMVYTMCHEIGHGFGLPHTDEDYFNRDRGDCMDYTDRLHNNLVPGKFNLDLLVELYGTPDRPLTEAPSAAPTQPVDAPTAPSVSPALSPRTPSPTMPPPPPEQGKNNKKKDNRRYLATESLDYKDMMNQLIDDCDDVECFYDVDAEHRVAIHKWMVEPPRS